VQNSKQGINFKMAHCAVYFGWNVCLKLPSGKFYKDKCFFSSILRRQTTFTNLQTSQKILVSEKLCFAFCFWFGNLKAFVYGYLTID